MAFGSVVAPAVASAAIESAGGVPPALAGGGGMGFIGPAILASSGLQAGASVAGGKKGAAASTKAAQLQFQAQMAALQNQQSVQQAIQGYVSPFINYGTNALGPLAAAIPSLTQPIATGLPSFDPNAALDPTKLAQTPGYQFTLKQAELAGQNALTTTGLGRSMSAVDTATQIAGGVAASTWPQVAQYNLNSYNANTNALLAGRGMQIQQNQQVANILGGQAGIGLQGVGVGTGAAVPLAAQETSAITGGGTALASGAVGSANALNQGTIGATNAIGGGVSQLANIALINQLGGGGGFNLFG